MTPQTEREDSSAPAQTEGEDGVIKAAPEERDLKVEREKGPMIDPQREEGW